MGEELDLFDRGPPASPTQHVDLPTDWARHPDWPAGAVMWRKTRRDPGIYHLTDSEAEARSWCAKGHDGVEALYPESFVRAILAERGPLP